MKKKGLILVLIITLISVFSVTSVSFGATKLAAPKVTAKVTKTEDVKVSWKKVKGATKYEIYKSSFKSKYYKKIATTKKLSYTDKDARYGVREYYKVKAVSGSKKSNFSKVKSAKISDDFIGLWEDYEDYYGIPDFGKAVGIEPFLTNLDDDNNLCYYYHYADIESIGYTVDSTVDAYGYILEQGYGYVKTRTEIDSETSAKVAYYRSQKGHKVDIIDYCAESVTDSFIIVLIEGEQ